jgi:hypothetical protein
VEVSATADGCCSTANPVPMSRLGNLPDDQGFFEQFSQVADQNLN